MNDSITNDSAIYCALCAKEVTGAWRGWPHKDPVPLIPRLREGLCEKCGSSEGLKSANIIWLNYHSAYSTGLPDYWILNIDMKGNRWGQPYSSEGSCPKCGLRSVRSLMHFPDGTREIKYNCPQCGVL
jgi:DNA-directed RNA polymerase subunit RPC12/RpoP